MQARAAFLRPSGTPPEHRLLHSLAEFLALQIVSGERRPGYVFPPEIEHAAILGVSRSVVREAFRVLISKGLVTSRPRAGTKVNQRDSWNLLDPDVLYWQSRGRPDENFLQELFELRLIVEPQAAEMAALRRTDAQLRAMAAALATLECDLLSLDERDVADIHFHTLILQATNNAMLAALSNSVAIALRVAATLRRLDTTPLPNHAPAARVIYWHIKEGASEDARKAMIAAVKSSHFDTTVALNQGGRGTIIAASS